MNQKKLFHGEGEKPHRRSRGEKLRILDRIVLPKVPGTSPSSLLHMLRVIDGFCGNYRQCVVRRKTLAERMRLQLRQTQRLLNALEALGLIRIEHLASRDGRRAASRYLPEWDAIEALLPAEPSAPTSGLDMSGIDSWPGCHGGTLAGPISDEPECHPVTPECHRGTALKIRLKDPSIDPPPPPAPSNRIAAALQKTEEGGGDFWKAEDLESLAAFLARLGDDSKAAGPLALYLSTQREAASRAGTADPVRSIIGLFNWRFARPTVEWKAWITQRGREDAERELSRHAAAQQSEEKR